MQNYTGRPGLPNDIEMAFWSATWCELCLKPLKWLIIGCLCYLGEVAVMAVTKDLVSFPDPQAKRREGLGDSLTFLISAQECM